MKHIYWLIIVAVSCFSAGLFVDHVLETRESRPESATPLRLGGYTYINPLLAYDIDRTTDNPKFNTVTHALQELIRNETVAGHIDEVSVYFRSLNTGEDFSINPNLTFEPGSLSKVPLLIALYKKVEDDPGFLKSEITLPTIDANAHIEVQPTQTLTPGKTYTVEQGIEKLILNSDNSPYQPLFNTINFADFQKGFNDLHLPFQKPSQGYDFFTTKDFSYFLRVLYNATYLTKEHSEQVMGLLTKTDFTSGIVAGLPKEVMAAHKFGISSHFTNNWSTLESRQLHDCGLVYTSNHPYILCVMTKGKGSLSDSENVLAKVSKDVYEAVKANFKE